MTSKICLQFGSQQAERAENKKYTSTWINNFFAF